MTEPVVSANGLRARLGTHEGVPTEFVLDAFTLMRSEQVAVTGPSGCGKTTLLNILCGLRSVDVGSVRLIGKELNALSIGNRDALRGRHVGFIYQSFNLLDGFTVEENLMVAMRFGRTIPHGERRTRAAALVQRVGLAHRASARPPSLSVGERQRAAVARALANRPDLILADEPTGSLDPGTATDVIELVLDVCREADCALLLVTHDLNLADRFTRRFDGTGLLRRGDSAEPHA